MAYRNIDPVTLMSGGVMTGTNKISSNPLDIGHLTCAAFSATWTGTAAGTMIVEGSLDGSIYADLGAGIPAVNGAGSAVVNLTNLAVRYVRLSYTNSSGSGSLNVIGAAKGI